MFGAILGDIIGAPFEFDRGKKTKDFPMFSRESHFTDDTVMTIAVAEALMDSRGRSEEETKQALVDSMRKWGRKYPHAGYGGHRCPCCYTAKIKYQDQDGIAFRFDPPQSAGQINRFWRQLSSHTFTSDWRK